MGMNAAVTRRDVSGIQITSWTFAFRLIAMVGRMSDIMPVSKGVTKVPRFTAVSENHLRLAARIATFPSAPILHLST